MLTRVSIIKDSEPIVGMSKFHSLKGFSTSTQILCMTHFKITINILLLFFFNSNICDSLSGVTEDKRSKQAQFFMLTLLRNHV